ncbi:uncharacterized protein BKA55DRAFT_586022 [Fusarium redolens]|uniref:Ankyrin repeat protein n=1 Tax=Fusarium redolens TaxID=48865 RepID=A0A9P9FYU0_FUSRE|nr:uncharacterized protein BKA55DRAFT_586022 [Fusarium redolens]KAH7210742.1 hypothetical protein BKA55DRAFT_586022 [Fusarium redolens]
MDQVQTAIHQHDYNGMKAVHYAAAVGDVDALKVLLFPANLFDRKVNIWRLQNELLRSERMPSQRQDAEHDHSTSDYLPDSDRPPQTWLDIFKELPADFKDRVELPNITFSEWRLVRSTYYLIPEKLSSKEKNRTPLHEAVLGGSLGAVKFLLSYSGIDASIRDVDGKTAAVLALGRDHYDVYNLIINHMREKEV